MKYFEAYILIDKFIVNYRESERTSKTVNPKS